ncbi:aspartic proteinase 36-like, partial [Fagus crenata]
QCGGSNFFDASKSSTAELVPCNHKMCTKKDCKGQCMYNITYVDGSQTTGYYVSDQLSFDQIRGQSMIDNASSIIFG